eukprot:Filipodium_phascolosomae@DN2106_c0_g1_i2.p1
MIDAAIVDEIKENLRPIKQGRCIAELHSQLADTKQIEPESARFEEALQDKTKNDDDAIDIAREYVHWLQNSCPSDSNRSSILEVLEHCVLRFLPNPELHDDDRYISLWLSYCGELKDATDIFKYLWSNKIGHNRSMFYAAWAKSLEERSQFGKALQVFTLGINNQAEPIEILKHRFERFQQRMKKRFKDDTSCDLTHLDVGRPLLNALSKREASSLHRPTEVTGLPAVVQAGRTSNGPTKVRGPMDVFEDRISSEATFLENAAASFSAGQLPSFLSKAASENTSRPIKKWDKV